jgi:Amt family ammonium transporter
VAITPAAGFVGPQAAILIGFGAGIICYGAVQLKNRLRVDDALDVWGVHGVGGAWGALATGLFATTAINVAGADGLFFGNATQVVKQLLAIGAVAAYAAVATWIILMVVQRFTPLRVEEEEETLGLDVSQHAEYAYRQ